MKKYVPYDPLRGSRPPKRKNLGRTLTKMWEGVPIPYGSWDRYHTTVAEKARRARAEASKNVWRGRSYRPPSLLP